MQLRRPAPGISTERGPPRSGEVSWPRRSLREVGSRLAQQGKPGALLFKSPSQRGLLGRKLLAAFQTRAHPDHKAEEGMAVLLVGDDIISTDDPVRVLVVVSPERMLLIEEALVGHHIFSGLMPTTTCNPDSRKLAAACMMLSC